MTLAVDVDQKAHLSPKSALMGIAVVGGGYLAVKSSGVMLNLGSVVVSGEAWVIVGAVIFFLITNKQHSVT